MADIRFTGATHVPPGAARPAVDSVDLHVRDGERLVLAGAPGSGKSTLLRMLSGLEPPDSGQLAIGETRLADLPPDRQWVSFVFEGFELLPNLTLFDNIALPLLLRRTPEHTVHAAVARAVDACGLTGALSLCPDEVPFETRLRTMLARAVVRRPAVVCLDEPLVGPDSCAGSDATAIIRETQRALGVTMIYATCRSADALALADRIAVLDSGRIQQVDRTRALVARPATLAVAQFAGPALIRLIRARVVNGNIRLGTLTVALTGNQVRGLTASHVLVGLDPARLLVGLAGPGIRATAVQVKDAGLFHVVRAVAELDSGPVELEATHVPGTPPGVGDRIVIGLPPQAYHLFDATTGRRLPD